MISRPRSPLLLALVATAAATTACEAPTLELPTAEAVTERYLYEGSLEAEMKGNVAEVRISQPAEQLRRGGTLWAKVGPYIFLFSEETRSLFEDYNGLAAVRVVTTAAHGREVARARLLRDELNDITWRHALSVAGRARRDGSSSPARIEDLVRYGEEHTEFQYSSEYVRN